VRAHPVVTAVTQRPDGRWARGVQWLKMVMRVAGHCSRHGLQLGSQTKIDDPLCYLSGQVLDGGWVSEAIAPLRWRRTPRPTGSTRPAQLTHAALHRGRVGQGEAAFFAMQQMLTTLCKLLRQLPPVGEDGGGLATVSRRCDSRLSMAVH
jgi:hypothetical protein